MSFILAPGYISDGFRPGDPYVPQADSDGASEEIVRRMLSEYRRASPSGEVSRALSVGDKRFVGVMGLGLAVPGVNTGRERQLQDWCGVKVIPLTSDAIESEEHGRFCDAAWAFARRYNRVLLQRLE